MTRAESAVRLARPLFQAEGSGSIPTSALCLWFSEIDMDRSKELNRLWHSNLPDVGGGGCRVAFVAECDGVFYATAIWTNPTSPKLPQLAWIQLTRFAIADDAPKNTASRMLGWMARDVRSRYADVTTLVTYLDCDKHDGTIYKACGWNGGDIEIRKGPGWSNRQRNYTDNDKPQRVQRWTKVIRK